jgi:hypothetical protein
MTASGSGSRMGYFVVEILRSLPAALINETSNPEEDPVLSQNFHQVI